MPIAGATYRDGVAYIDGALCVTPVGNAAITGGTISGATISDSTLTGDISSTGTDYFYNTTIDPVNHERAQVGWVSNTFVIRPAAAGTGTARNMSVGPNGSNTSIFLRAGGSDRWRVDSTVSGGPIYPVTDNASDIGQSGNRVKDFYLYGTANLANGVAVPAGGSSAAFVHVSSTAGLGIYFGSGAPTVSAAQGSLYIRTDGSSTSTRLYVNTNGTTGWTNVTTAA